MNELKIFDNEEFGQVRSIEVNGVPYFVANDVAKALGYTNPSKATNDHCKKAVMVWGNDSLGRRQEFKVIPEGDIYRLVVKSQLKSAEQFESWIFDEVLPALRKTGTYTVNPTYQYPVSPAAIDSATNAGRLFERIMKAEGIPPHKIAMVVRSIFLQAGVEVPSFVIAIPPYEQYTLPFDEILVR